MAVKVIKVVGTICFYVTAFTLGGICGWANNKFLDWVDEAAE